MVYINNSKEFVRQNHGEIRNMVTSLCHTFGVETAGDVTNDLCVRIISGRLMEDHFDPQRSKVSTYIFRIVRNMICNQIYSRENRTWKNRQIVPFQSGQDEASEDLDFILRYNHIANEYKDILRRNAVSDDPEGLPLELNDFERKFAKGYGSKRIPLKKRSFKDVQAKRCTRYDVYCYIKQGYKNSEIARLYGVTDMFICLLKKEIEQALRDYGFDFPKKPRKKRTRRKL